MDLISILYQPDAHMSHPNAATAAAIAATADKSRRMGLIAPISAAASSHPSHTASSQVGSSTPHVALAAMFDV